MLPLDLVDVQQELRRVADPGDGAVAVPAAGEGEVGDRVEFEQKRTGHLEEVRQEFVGRPLDDERREAVEDVEDLPSLRLDDLVEGAAEGVEAGMGIDLDRFEPVDAAAGSADGGRSGSRSHRRPSRIACRAKGSAKWT